MKIPAYQIQNVLRLYFRQLGEGEILEKSESSPMVPDRPRVMSSEGTRQAIIDKVAADIVEKIISKAGEPAPLNPVSGRQGSLSAGKSDPRYRDKARFNYLLIDQRNNRTLRTAKDILPRRNPSQPDD